MQYFATGEQPAARRRVAVIQGLSSARDPERIRDRQAERAEMLPHGQMTAVGEVVVLLSGNGLGASGARPGALGGARRGVRRDPRGPWLASVRSQVAGPRGSSPLPRRASEHTYNAHASCHMVEESVVYRN